MGNEFGHPEWIDFPREGNGWSYHYARRLWSLADDECLKYGGLQEFDRAMLHLDYTDEAPRFLHIHEENKILAFRKGKYTYIFNFHPTRSHVYSLERPRSYTFALHSAWQEFGGHVNSATNEGLVRNEGIVLDRRCAVVLERKA